MKTHHTLFKTHDTVDRVIKYQINKKMISFKKYLMNKTMKKR